MNETIDRRAARTKASLKNAMLELLKKKDIAKITVSELTERADIGRGTFYLHYSDPYDLLDKIEDEALEKISALTFYEANSGGYDQLLHRLEHVWRYVYDNREIFKVLLHHQDGTRFMRKFGKYCEKEALAFTGTAASVDAEDAYVITYIISGTMGIFQKWMKDGAVFPPERLAQIARDMISGTPS